MATSTASCASSAFDGGRICRHINVPPRLNHKTLTARLRQLEELKDLWGPERVEQRTLTTAQVAASLHSVGFVDPSPPCTTSSTHLTHLPLEYRPDGTSSRLADVDFSSFSSYYRCGHACSSGSSTSRVACIYSRSVKLSMATSIRL